MNHKLSIAPIGFAKILNGRFSLELLSDYRMGLNGLEDFSHAIALWWAHTAGDDHHRSQLTRHRPYAATSADFGVFATRSETRPNPIGLSVFSIETIDIGEGVVTSPYFDMLPQTPILDLKPYFPASDRVFEARIPGHFDHWPGSLEDSAEFDWSKEFRG